MPITVAPEIPTIVGPGTSFQVSTDLIGPIPLEWNWVVSVYRDDISAENPMAYWTSKANGSHTQVLENYQAQFSNFAGDNLQQGVPCTVQFRLLGSDGVTTEDASDRFPVKWDGSGALARWIQHQVPAQGGLTPQESEQLAETTAATAVELSIDALTLTEATSGPTGLPVNVPLGFATFGVIVRLSTIPDGLEPQTPDAQYWVKTLAVVRLFRGNDLWFRVPIHTPTKIVPFAHEGLQVWVTSAQLNEWILNIRVLVDWLPGVTGRVFLMHTP